MKYILASSSTAHYLTMAAEELVITNIRTPGTMSLLKALSQYFTSLLLTKFYTDITSFRFLGWI